MKARGKIKVIKKGEVRSAAMPAEPAEKSDQTVVSEMTSTVSGWIDEFQRTRLEKEKLASEQFYS